MINNNEINFRIKQLIDYKTNGNQKKFSEIIGFKPQVISNIVSGRMTKPSFEVLNSIISSFVDIDSQWLLTGKGKILKNDNKSEDDLKTVPLIPLDAMAGFGAGDVSIMEYDLERYYVPEFDQLKVDYMIRVKGSSMIPKYNSGDIVACRQLSKNDLFFQWHKVYVLDTIQGALIKRIEPSEKEGCVQLVSENEKYKPFDLNIDTEIHAIALVVGVIRFE